MQPTVRAGGGESWLLLVGPFDSSNEDNEVGAQTNPGSSPSATASVSITPVCPSSERACRSPALMVSQVLWEVGSDIVESLVPSQGEGPV